MGRKRILIATDILFLHLMKGNHNRIRSYFECLKKHYDVDIFFLQDKNDNSVQYSNIYYYSDFLPSERKSIKIEQPYNISSRVKYEYKLAFDNFVENNEYDYIILPYIWNSYLIDTKPNTNSKFICDTHDSFSERTKSFKKHKYKFSSPCTEDEEKFCLRNFDYIMAISDEEKRIFENMGYDNVFTCKYYYKPEPSKKKLGIIGSQSPHNIDALWWFYNHVFKYIEDDYYLYVCGELAKNSEVDRIYKGCKNIVLYNRIWNIEDFYNMVDICINPCQMGSGLKIKNIEALSFNKPIITTKVGMQGLSSESDIIIEANTKDEWISAIKMLSDKNLYQYTMLLTKINEYNKNNNGEKVYRDLLKILQ